MIRFIHWNINTKVGILFALIGIFSLINFSTILVFKSKQKSDSVLVNVSGRNRMLSQRIGLYAHMHLKDINGAKAELTRLVDLHEKSILAIKNGGKAPGVVGAENLPQADPFVLAQVEQVIKLWNNYKANAFVIASESASPDDKRAALIEIEGNSTTMLAENNKLVEAYVELNSVKQAKRNTIQYALLVLNLAVIILGLIIVSKFIVNPVKKLSGLMLKLANGQLDSKESYTSKDEIGVLFNSYNFTIENLEKVISNIESISGIISTTGSHLNKSSVQSANESNTQAATIEQLSTSMEEIAANIQQNTDNAQQTEIISKEANSSIQEVKVKAENALQASQNISNKINLINDIALQTNILALNATIEAARAGIHGKGFAVVAAEVRKLAELSKSAAQEVTELAGRNLNFAKDTGQILNDTTPKIDRTNASLQEISAASVEQNSGVAQINSGIQQLNSVSQKSAASSEELAKSSEQLMELANRLKDSIAYFSTASIGKKSVKSIRGVLVDEVNLAQ